MKMNTTRKLWGGLLTAGLILVGVIPAQATPVTWYLQDWEFSDGSAASGSYIFDVDVSPDQNPLRWTDIDITSEIGSTTFNFRGTPGVSDQLAFVTGEPGAGDLTGTYALLGELPDNAGMTNAGGTIDLVLDGGTNFFSSQLVCTSSTCGSAAEPIYLVSGSITTVPEPSAAVLTALGLIGLASRKQRP
jgi:hypothetical protein